MGCCVQRNEDKATRWSFKHLCWIMTAFLVGRSNNFATLNYIIEFSILHVHLNNLKLCVYI